MIKENGSKKIRIFFKTAVTAFLLSTAVLALCIVNTNFAQWYCDTVSAFFRYVAALVTGFLPVSVAEICVILLPFVFVLLVIFAVRAVVKRSFNVKSTVMTVFSVIFSAYAVFVNVFAVCYFKYPLEAQLDLERSALAKEELYSDAVYTHKMLCDYADDVNYDKSGASVSPRSFYETGKLIDKGYDALSDSGVYKSIMIGNAKPVFLSKLMTYTHISGMYMPFTGEANVNTNYPDYVVAFTIAHEKAHQRGIADEDEANFMAFLACMASDDEYLKYSAMMNMYDYYLDETLVNDTQLYTELVENTDRRIIGEMFSYYNFFKKYSDSSAAKAADKVNDTYIKAMGNDDGIKSYGLVIELYHAYIVKENNNR